MEDNIVTKKKVKAIDANTDFVWAYNKIKLKQAYAAVVEANKLDKSVLVNEETIKEFYIERAGLLADDQVIVKNRKRAKHTSNRD